MLNVKPVMRITTLLQVAVHWNHKQKTFATISKFFEKSIMGMLAYFLVNWTLVYPFLPKYTDIQRKNQVEKPINLILIN